MNGAPVGGVGRAGQVLPLRAFLSPWGMVTNLHAKRRLVWQLAVRDLVARHRDTRLGILWSVLRPLAALATYTFVFSVVLDLRFGNRQWSHGDFALALYGGLLCYELFAEVAGRAPRMITANPSYVRKVVFPLEILVVSSVVAAAVQMAIGYGVWFTGWAILRGEWAHATALWLPIVLVPVLLAAVGVGWFLSSLGTFFRDLGPAVGLALHVLFFLTPIFYGIEQVPWPYRWILEMNPLAHAVENVRRLLMWGEPPLWDRWLLSMVCSAALSLLGYAFFMKSKRAFADVV